MQYVCDASPKLTWFRLETEGEASHESAEMNHKVAKHFIQTREDAEASWRPPTSARYIEQDIGKKDHVVRTMPIFLTLRDEDGKPLVTAMLPPRGRADQTFRPVVVGEGNSDPYPEYGDAIAKLARHFGTVLESSRCYPYRRR